VTPEVHWTSLPLLSVTVNVYVVVCVGVSTIDPPVGDTAPGSGEMVAVAPLVPAQVSVADCPWVMLDGLGTILQISPPLEPPLDPEPLTCAYATVLTESGSRKSASANIKNLFAIR